VRREGSHVDIYVVVDQNGLQEPDNQHATISIDTCTACHVLIELEFAFRIEILARGTLDIPLMMAVAIHPSSPAIRISAEAL
jgi:hypothetical protein